MACCSRAAASNGRMPSRRPCEMKTRSPRRCAIPDRHAGSFTNVGDSRTSASSRLVGRERDVGGDHAALRKAGQHLSLARIAAGFRQLAQQRPDAPVRRGQPRRIGRREIGQAVAGSPMRVEPEAPPGAAVRRAVGRRRRVGALGHHEAAAGRQRDGVGERDPLVRRRAVAVNQHERQRVPFRLRSCASPEASCVTDAGAGRPRSAMRERRSGVATRARGSPAGHCADDQERLAPGGDRRRQRIVGRGVRPVFLAGEEAHERPAPGGAGPDVAGPAAEGAVA